MWQISLNNVAPLKANYIPITLVHITYVFNVANAVYLSRKLSSKVDKNRNLNLLTRYNKKWI